MFFCSQAVDLRSTEVPIQPSLKVINYTSSLSSAFDINQFGSPFMSGM